MTDYKFKGTTVKGEVIEGSLVITTNFIVTKPKQHTKTWIVQSSFGNGGWFNIRKKQYVLPETVSQIISCDECKFRPVKGDVYPEICSSCCRWYADMYEKDLS